MSEASTLHGFWRGILERPDLASKLDPPPDLGELQDADFAATGVEPLLIERPARDADLRMSGGAPALPRPGELKRPEARAQCLARFAHHELMAVELFAWALLRWPELPVGLRRAWHQALLEEQLHCRLYLDRLAATGADFGEFQHSEYFWKQTSAIAASPAGASAFLAGIGLTLEQANLDFCLVYRDAFRRAGDEATALVCQRVHDDEIGHVGLAYRWLRRLSDPAFSALEAYLDAVPFPLGPARAKARAFHPSSRRRAGLDEEFIAHVKRARSNQELQAHPDQIDETARTHGEEAKPPEQSHLASAERRGK